MDLPVMLTMKLHVAIFPLLSTALHKTSVKPKLKTEPDEGSHTTSMSSSLLSVATPASHTTIAVDSPMSVLLARSAGQECILGSSSSIYKNIPIKNHHSVSLRIKPFPSHNKI